MAEHLKAGWTLRYSFPPQWSRWDEHDYFAVADLFTELNYPEEVEFVRKSVHREVDRLYFWREYVWCVLVGGFNASVVAGFYNGFMDALGWDPLHVHEINGAGIVFGNRNKLNALLKCARMIQGDGWQEFYRRFVGPKRIDILQSLPHIGAVTCHHLARNIGIDTVKPDLHLVRLATHFGYPTPMAMCKYLSAAFRVPLVGEVDLKLFMMAAQYGTKELGK